MGSWGFAHRSERRSRCLAQSVAHWGLALYEAVLRCADRAVIREAESVDERA
jgi:hypothetical protein